MNYSKWGYEFDGPYNNPNMLRPAPSVYVIWCQTRNQWKILDVGESENVVETIIYHENAGSWKQNCSGTIRYSAAYLSAKKERLALEKKIRNSNRIVCEDHKAMTDPK